MRRFVSLALTLLLALAMMPALSPSASAEEVYTLDYYWIGNGDNAVRASVQDAINAYIEPLIGAHVEFHIIAWGDWPTKAVTALQSGEKMDIIFTADWRDYTVEVSGGLLLPLNDDQGPYGNLLEQYGQDYLQTINPAFIVGTQVNGVAYGVATNKELAVPQGFIVNKKAAAEIGWDVQPDDPSITSTADLEQYLAAYKALYPEYYPYFSDGGRWAEEPWAPGWTSINGNLIAQKQDPDANGEFDETIYKVWDTEEQAGYARLMYDFAQKGYIDPDSILTSFDNNAVFNSGNFLVYVQPLKGNNIKSQELINASGNPDLECVEITMQPKVVVTTHTGGSMLAIPVTCEDPVKAMQYINLMHCDTTLVNMMLYGVEGTHWAFEDDGRVNLIDAAWSGSIGGAWTVGNTAIQAVTNKEDPEKNELLQRYADDAVGHPSLGFRFVQDPVANEIAALTNVNTEFHRALMVGGADPDDPQMGLEAYRAALEAAGIDAVLAEAQAQYDAWKAAK